MDGGWTGGSWTGGALLGRVRADGGLIAGGAMLFLLGALTALALTARGRMRAVAAGAVVALTVLLAGGGAFAHEGEDHGHGDKPPAET